MSGRLDLVSPNITALYGTPLPTKRRAIYVNQAQFVDIQFQFLDTAGNPVDIDEYCDFPAGSQVPQGAQGVQAPCIPDIKVRLREVIALNLKIYEVTCLIIDAAIGLVQFTVPAAIVKNPGVYLAEFAVFLPDLDVMSFTNKCYLWVDRGLFGTPLHPHAGPPTLDEVRLYVRDNAPEENLLLDDFEFDLAEICQSTENGVRYWNESQPPIRLVYDTTTYFIRDKWLTYIAGHMFICASHRFRRNQLAYQAGGIAIDDQNKYQMYMQTGMAMQQDYKEWVKQKKVQLNCEAAITGTGSPYGSLAYRLVNTGV